MYKIKNLTSGKELYFKTTKDFIEVTKNILENNKDKYALLNSSDCVVYINEFCDDLQLTLSPFKSV